MCRDRVFPRVGYFLSRQNVAKTKGPCVVTRHFMSQHSLVKPRVFCCDRVFLCCDKVWLNGEVLCCDIAILCRDIAGQIG